MSETSAETCAMCTNEATICCEHCKLIDYCSSVCQKADWEIHRILCSSPDMTGPPKADMVRGLYFPEHSADPQVIWLTVSIDQETGDQVLPDLLPYFLSKEEPYAKPVPLSVGINKIRKRLLLLDGEFQALRFFQRKGFAYDSSGKNPGVEKLTGGTVAYPWRGPLVVTVVKVSDEESYGDFSMRDFRDAVDAFHWFRGYVSLEDISFA